MRPAIIGVLVACVFLVSNVATVHAGQVQTASCTTALLIIDVQRAWIHSSFTTIDGVYITTKIESILNLVRGTGIQVVFIKDISMRGRLSEWSLDMPIQLQPIEGEWVREKPLNDAFSYTTLDDALRARGITRVLIAGLTSNSCVAATIMGARVHDYEITILADAHTGGEYGRIARQMNDNWAATGLNVVNSKDIDLTSLCSGEPQPDGSD